jgi:hypothetical protein
MLFNFRKQKKMLKDTKFTSLLIVGIMFYASRFTINIATCDELYDLLSSLSISELETFMDLLLDEEKQETFIKYYDVLKQQEPQSEDTSITSTDKWQGLALFLVLTATLFVIATYGDTILDILIRDNNILESVSSASDTSSTVSDMLEETEKVVESKATNSIISQHWGEDE